MVSTLEEFRSRIAGPPSEEVVGDEFVVPLSDLQMQGLLGEVREFMQTSSGQKVSIAWNAQRHELTLAAAPALGADSAPPTPKVISLKDAVWLDGLRDSILREDGGRLFDNHLGGPPLAGLVQEEQTSTPSPAKTPIALRQSEESGVEPRMEVQAPTPASSAIRGQNDALPRSFLWNYVPSGIASTFAWEILLVALPLYTAGQFGILEGIIATGFGYMMRIPGAWIGERLVQRVHDPKWVNISALLMVGAAGWLIPAFHGIYAAFLLNAGINGLAYGATRGVLESIIPRRIIGGRNPELLERGLNQFNYSTEAAAILVAFLAVPMTLVLGGGLLMMAASGMMMLAAVLQIPMRYREAKDLESGSPGLRSELKTAKEYLPFIFFKFVHYVMYAVLPILLSAIFASDLWAGNVIGAYDAGSFLLSFLVARSLLPEMGVQGWTVAGTAVLAGFLWSTYLVPVPLITAALGGLLGGLIAVTLNKWAALYNERLSQVESNQFAKWAMTFSTLGLLPVYAAVQAIKMIPGIGESAAVPHLFLALSAGISVVAGLIAHSIYRKSSLKGKTLLLVGSYLPMRSFILDAAVATGATLILVDDESRRQEALKYVRPENFIAAPVMDATRQEEVVAKVREYLDARAGFWNAALRFVQRLFYLRKPHGGVLDGVFNSLDPYVLPHARLVDALGLPGDGYAVALKTKDKYLMRKEFENDKDLHVDFALVKSEEEALQAFRRIGPGVMKPPMGANSMFAAAVRSEEEAITKYRTLSEGMRKYIADDPVAAAKSSLNPDRGFLYEAFIGMDRPEVDGDEVDIEILVQNGVVKFIEVADNLKTEPPYFVERGDNYPSQRPEKDIEAYKALGRKVVQISGIMNGNVHFEARMTPHGPRPVESNKRMIGDFGYYVYKEVWGVDLVEMAMKIAAGIEIPDMTQLRPRKQLAAREWPVPKSGVIESIGPEVLDMSKNPKKYGLFKLDILKGVGDTVLAPPESMGDRPLYVLAVGDTFEEAEARADQAFKKIKDQVVIRPKSNP